MALQAIIDHASPEFNLSLPAEVDFDHSGYLQVARFGELDVLEELGLLSCSNPNKLTEQVDALRRLAGAQTYQSTYKGDVVGVGDYVVKTYYGSTALKEAIMLIAVRDGLEQVAPQCLRPTIPRVIAGHYIGSRSALVIQRFPHHEPVTNYSEAVQAIFEAGKPNRLALYRAAFQAVGIHRFTPLRDGSLDDTPKNTLWPAAFHDEDDGTNVAADMVRIDFENLDMPTSDLVFNPVS
jgi:hypothetical protein